MAGSSALSRRERQIMDILFSRGDGTVRQIQSELPDPPTDMAVRRMLHILEEKGHLKRRKKGREVIYRPAQSKSRAGSKALEHVLNTFFGGSVDEALAAHLASKKRLSSDDLNRLQERIDEARKEGR